MVWSTNPSVGPSTEPSQVPKHSYHQTRSIGAPLLTWPILEFQTAHHPGLGNGHSPQSLLRNQQPPWSMRVDHDYNPATMQLWPSILGVTNFGLAFFYKYPRLRRPLISNSFPNSLLSFYSNSLTLTSECSHQGQSQLETFCRSLQQWLQPINASSPISS